MCLQELMYDAGFAGFNLRPGGITMFISHVVNYRPKAIKESEHENKILLLL
jgi:hypothetical protein